MCVPQMIIRLGGRKVKKATVAFVPIFPQKHHQHCNFPSFPVLFFTAFKQGDQWYELSNVLRAGKM